MITRFSYTLHLLALIGMLNAPLLVAKKAHDPTPTIYEQIAPSYLATFPLVEQEEAPKKKKQWAMPQLDERTLRRIGINLLKKDDQKNASQSTIITPEVWDNLELFANNSQQPEKTVVGAIKRTHTRAGEITLIKMLARPTTDTSLLVQRQKMIKYLVENDNVYHQLRKIIQPLKNHEGSLYSLTMPTDPILQPLFDILYKGRILPATPGGFMADRVLLDLAVFFFMPLMLVGGGSLASASYKMGGIEGKGTTAFLALLMAINTGVLIHGRIKLPQFWGYIKKRMRSASMLTHALRKLRILMKKQQFAVIRNEVTKQKYRNRPAYKKMVERLSHKTFNSKPSFFEHTGAIIATLPAVKKGLPDLFKGIHLIGLMDAYLSIATLVREHKQKDRGYCFVSYLQEDTPVIKAEDFWHPTISADRAVPNSIELGTPGAPRNLVITGANAGGKSTTMKGLALGILLGQTFGIAPATSFALTPFSRINTYLNITDDISADRSLFRAELFRAQTLLNEVQALKGRQFSFTILDEILTGTERIEGEAAAYGIARRLAEFPHAMVLLATHFSGLTYLEADTNGIYKNMKVVVDIDEDKNFHFPFKLFEGKTNQQIAIDIIEKEGFDDLIVNKAKDVLLRPEHYLPTKHDI